MRELFRGADTDGSGALSRAVRITYRNARPMGALIPAACCAFCFSSDVTGFKICDCICVAHACEIVLSEVPWGAEQRLRNVFNCHRRRSSRRACGRRRPLGCG